MLVELLRACESGRKEELKKLLERHGDPFNVRFEGGRSLLHVAAEKGQYEVVVYLCGEVGLNNSLRDEYGNAPLHDAAHYGHLDVVTYLIEKLGSDPTCRGEGSCTALHTSCQGGQLEVVQYLVNVVDPFISDEDGDTPLHYAASHGKIDIVKFYYEKVQVLVPCCNNEGINPLHTAALNQALNVVQYLVTFQYCDPTSESNNGCTAMHAACEGGCLKTVKYLAENGDDILTQKEDMVGKLPLHYAAQFGHLAIVRYLIEVTRCDSMHKTSAGNTPLHLAARQGHFNVVTYLTVVQQCSPIFRGEMGWTALHAASEGGHIDIVRHLVTEQEVSPSIEDEEGMTALHMAAMHGHLELVEFFVEEQNCSIYHRNCDHNTPIHLAAGNGHLDVIQYFIDIRKCDPMTRGQADYTPLHAACTEGHLNAAKYLVDVGVDVSTRGSNGITAFDIAVTKGYHSIVRLLRKSLGRARQSSDSQSADDHDDLLSSRGQLLPFAKRKLHCSQEILGRGMFGTVYEVNMSGKSYAAKIFNTANNEKLCRKLSSEVNILSNVRHPHLVQYYGLIYFPDKDLPALLMEKMMTNLHTHILDMKNEIEVARKFSLLCDVASGLSYLHGHNPVIVHRDLTAKNVLLDSSLTGKIADFGNSRILDMDTDLTPESMTAQPGTLDYMPPEAFGENPTYDTKLDLFSFGHLSLFTLTGAVHKLLPLRKTGENDLSLRSEWERRSNHSVALCSILGRKHVFIHAIEQCLSNDANKRPTASVLRVQLIDLAGSVRPVNTEEILNATVTMRELTSLKTPNGESINILRHLAPQWKQLGTLLEFDAGGETLDIISADRTKDGCVACCQSVFSLWLKGRGTRQPASWAVVLQLLEEMRKMWLLRKVKSCLQLSL